MATNFTVEIDWNHNGTWTDETSRTRRVQIRAGFEEPWQFVAAGGRCVLTMENTNERFSPGNSNGALYGKLLPRRAVRVSATSGGSTWRLFRGFIAAIRPDAGEHGRQECVIECVDGMAMLADQPISVAHASSKAVDEAVDEVVSAAYTPKSEAYSDNGDVLEHYGRSWVPEETSCLAALEEICQAVYGRFFLARDGEATFLSRNDLLDASENIVAILGDAPYWKVVKFIRRTRLVGYWRLNESEGSTVEDSSGNGFDGIAAGVTWGQEGIGDGDTAPLLDGINDYICLDGAGLFGAFDPDAGTILLWMRVASASVWSDGQYRYMAEFRADWDNRLWIYKHVSGSVYVCMRRGATTDQVVISGLSTTNWICLAMTWDASADELKVYKNAVQQGTTQTGLGTWSGTINTAMVGAMNLTPNYVWDGCLAHVALWDVALAADEIAILAEV